jgi:hypothetical protein
MSIDSSPPSPTLVRGQKLLNRGTWLYFLLMPLEIFELLKRSSMSFIMGVALICMALAAPVLARKGSEWSKNFAGIVSLGMVGSFFFNGLMMIIVSKQVFLGSLILICFVPACYLVRVFLINQDVKDYVTSLATRS